MLTGMQWQIYVMGEVMGRDWILDISWRYTQQYFLTNDMEYERSREWVEHVYISKYFCLKNWEDRASVDKYGKDYEHRF